MAKGTVPIENYLDHNIKKTNHFFSWVQEFTKKIVTVAFIIYVFTQLFSCGMVVYHILQSQELTYLDILITESNETFRNVIGGYIIKAACENAVKIAGSIMIKRMDSKMKTETTEEEELEILDYDA